MCLASVSIPYTPFAGAVWAALMFCMLVLPKPGKLGYGERGAEMVATVQLIRRNMTGFVSLPRHLGTQGVLSGQPQAKITYASLGASCAAVLAAACDLMVSHALAKHTASVPSLTLISGVDFAPAERVVWITAPASAWFGWVAAHACTSVKRMRISAKKSGHEPNPKQECPAAIVKGTTVPVDDKGNPLKFRLWSSDIRTAVQETLQDIINETSKKRFLSLAAGLLLLAAADISAGLFSGVTRPVTSNIGIAGPVLAYLSTAALMAGHRALAEDIEQQRAEWEAEKKEIREWPRRWASMPGENIDTAPSIVGWGSKALPEIPGKQPTHKQWMFQMMPGKDFSNYLNSASRLAPALGKNMIIIEELRSDPSSTSKDGLTKWGFTVTHELDPTIGLHSLQEKGLDEQTQNFILKYMVLTALKDLKLPQPSFLRAERLTKINLATRKNRKWIFETQWAMTSTAGYSDYASKTEKLREKLGCDWARVFVRPHQSYISIIFGHSPIEAKPQPQHLSVISQADWNYFMRYSNLIGTNKQPPAQISVKVDEKTKQQELVFALQPGLTEESVEKAIPKLLSISGLSHIRIGPQTKSSEVTLYTSPDDPLERSYNYGDYAHMILSEPVLGEPRLNWHIGVGYDGELVKFDWGADTPHLLIAGNTGSGKSGVVNAMLTQMLHNNEPEDVEFWMADPKNELQVYQHLAHVKYFLDMSVTEDNIYSTINCLLQTAEDEMNRRYKTLASHPQKPQNLKRARAIASENPEKYGYLNLPYIFLVIEECSTYLKKPETQDNTKLWLSMNNSLTQIAMKGRAAGITIITCTQYPVKENISTTLKQQSRRIGLRTADLQASRVIIDMKGLEEIKSPGRGKLSTTKGMVDFRGLWLRNPHEDGSDIPDERMKLIEGICYTKKWPKLPEGVNPGALVIPCDDDERIYPEKKIFTGGPPRGRDRPLRKQSHEDWLNMLSDTEDGLNFDMFADDPSDNWLWDSSPQKPENNERGRRPLRGKTPHRPDHRRRPPRPRQRREAPDSFRGPENGPASHGDRDYEPARPERDLQGEPDTGLLPEPPGFLLSEEHDKDNEPSPAPEQETEDNDPLDGLLAELAQRERSPSQDGSYGDQAAAMSRLGMSDTRR